MELDWPHEIADFVYRVDHSGRREDAAELFTLMRDASGAAAPLWKGGMIGFGSYNYTYASGRSGTWFLTGFAPRKANMSIYIMPGFDRYADLLDRLGPHKTGRSCLYLGRLAKVDVSVLRELVAQSVTDMRAMYPDEPST